MTALWPVVLCYAALVALAVAMLPLRTALIGSYLAGWLLLPVGVYPLGLYGFTIELVGGALPATNMLVTKAWIVPAVVLAVGIVAGWRRVAAWRPAAIDLPVVMWCLWPLAAAVFAADPDPSASITCLYLAGAWGAPWLIGRLLLSDAEGRRALLDGIADTALLIAPLAWVEGLRGPFVYGLFYGDHPFLTDGVTRYVGSRPLIFFEHGNQYGIAIALAALAAIAAWRLWPSRFAMVRAGVLALTALASQSAGGVILLAVGAAALLVPARLVRPVAIVVAGAALLAAPVYVSGVVPVDRLVRHTAPGQKLLALVRATGRGSIAWRVSQDQKVAPLVRAHPVAGTSRWDWWRPAGARPWGLALLILGQFGLVGLALAGSILLAPVARLAWRRALDPAIAPLAVIALLAALDAMLNAFVFLPALAAAGACAVRLSRDQ